MQRTMGFLIGLSASAMLAVACGAKESGANPADRLTGIVVREEIPEGSSLVRDAVRDASTVTGEEKAARAQFGWGNGADVLDVAQRDTLSRDLAGVPHPPFPMTDEEYRRYSEHNEAVLAAGPVIDEIVAKYSDVLTEVAVDTSSLHLRLVLTYKYGEDPTLAAAALRERLGVVEISERSAALSTADLESMWRQLTAGEAQAELDGVRISGLEIWASNGLRVIVPEGDWARAIDGRRLEQRLREVLSLPADLKLAVVAATAGSDRTNDAGQMKAGLRINSPRGDCTSNVAAATAGVKGFLTAKHCVQLGSSVSFNGRVVGQPTSLGSCEVCADDWAFVTTPSAGLASEYSFIQLSANADVRVEPITGAASTPPVGTAAASKALRHSGQATLSVDQSRRSSRVA